jgi:hypothetical protein
MVNFLSRIKTGQVKLGKKSSDEINFILTGDFCPIGSVEELCSNNEFEKIYGNALPILKDKDLFINHLKLTCVADKSPPSPYRLSGTPDSR